MSAPASQLSRQEILARALKVLVGHRASVPPHFARSLPTNALEYLLRYYPDVRQPNRYDCGACTAMAAGGYRHVGPRRLSAWVKALGTSVEKSTHPFAIRDYLHSLGLLIEADQGMTLADLQDATRRGNPVLVCLQDYGSRREPGALYDYGHYLSTLMNEFGIVVCQDSSIQNVQREPGGDVPEKQADPSENIAAPGRVAVYADTFLEAWHDKDIEGNKFVRFGIIVGPKVGMKSFDESKHPRGNPDNAGQFASAPGSPSSASSSALADKPPASESEARSVLSAVGSAAWDAFAAIGHNAGHIEHVAKEYVTQHIEQNVAKLPPKLQAVVKGTWKAVRLGTKALFATYTAGQVLAEQVAKEKGASDEEASKLRAVLSTVDVATFKPVSIGLVASGVGVGVATALTFVPLGTMSYLAYSTATNPLSTIKAAQLLARAAMAKLHLAKSLGQAEQTAVAGDVYDALKAHGFSEHYTALLMAALDETKDLRLAVLLANAADRGEWPGKSWDKSESSGNGRWVTIGAHGSTGDRHGGVHVYIEHNGTISRGPAQMLGRKPSEIGHRITAEHGDKHPVTATREGPKQQANTEENSHGEERRDGVDGRRGENTAGETARVGGPVAEEAVRSGDQGDDRQRADATESSGEEAAGRVPARIEEVNRRLDRFEKHFRSKGQQEVADWMGLLRSHINAAGVEASLAALGEEGDKGSHDWTQYEGRAEEMPAFCEAYLNRYGISPVVSSANPDVRLISSQSGKFSAQLRPDPYLAGDFAPRDPGFKDKLEEAKHLPGLEKSEDINVIMGKPTSHLTPEVMAKMDERYGEGGWIIKTYGEMAFNSNGVYFPQRAKQIAQDARNTIWSSGEHLSKYGFGHLRDESGKVVGIKHKDGEEYRFGTEKYDRTIHGDVRHWCDQVAFVAGNEKGAALPFEGKDFMAQPAFPVVGVSEAERAAGKTIAPGEGRVHIVTRNGKAEIIPHSTWIKGEHLPVVFESEDTKAMAQAAVDAINALPESERSGQIYAPDIVRSKDGFKVVEANPANETGSSGYLGDNPFIIDSYVSHLTGREPAHVQFIRKLLRSKDRKRIAGSKSHRPFDSDKHPRGHEGNPGQFAKKPGTAEKEQSSGQDAVEDAAKDWKQDGVRSKAFKEWFGDWENDPKNASKVVDDRTGEPKETYTAKKVFHGTQHDFSVFDPEKLGSSTKHPTAQLGFFFTESRNIARQFAGEGSVLKKPKTIDQIAVQMTGEGRGYNYLPLGSKERNDVQAAYDAQPEIEEWTVRDPARGEGKVNECYLNIRNPYKLTFDVWHSMFVRPCIKGDREAAERNVQSFKQKLLDEGYDGIFFEKSTGLKANNEFAHNTWIAFEPTQIKAATNRGTFDPADPNINKAWDESKHPKDELGRWSEKPGVHEQQTRQEQPPAPLADSPTRLTSGDMDIQSNREAAERRRAAIAAGSASQSDMPTGPDLEAGQVEPLNLIKGQEGTSQCFEVGVGVGTDKEKWYFVKQIKDEIFGEKLDPVESQKNETAVADMAALAGVRVPACIAVSFGDQASVACPLLNGHALGAKSGWEVIVRNQVEKEEVAGHLLFSYLLDLADRHRMNYFFEPGLEPWSMGKLSSIDHEFSFESTEQSSSNAIRLFKGNALFKAIGEARRDEEGFGYNFPLPADTVKKLVDAVPQMVEKLRQQGRAKQAEWVEYRGWKLQRFSEHGGGTVGDFLYFLGDFGAAKP